MRRASGDGARGAGYVRLNARLDKAVRVPDAHGLQLQAGGVGVSAEDLVATGRPRDAGAHSERDDGGVVAQVEVTAGRVTVCGVVGCSDWGGGWGGGGGGLAHAPPGFRAEVQVLPSLSCWKPAADSASVHVLTTVNGQVAELMNSRNLSANARAAGATRDAIGGFGSWLTEVQRAASQNCGI
jgi:hypothetical protein